MSKLETGLKWVLGCIIALVVSPVIFLVIKGMVGLAIALFVGGVCIQFTPVVATALANGRLLALTKVVEGNPIETMKNLFIEKNKELQEADNRIVDFQTEISNFDDEVKDFSRNYPDEAPRYREISGVMSASLTEMKERQTDAKTQVKELGVRISKAEALYKMALAAERVTAFSKSTEAKVLQDIKEKVAFDSVRNQLNRAFSELNVSLAKQTERPMLTSGSSMTALPTTAQSRPVLARR